MTVHANPPRVQITYDVETLGAMCKVELPFVVGVLADLTGQPAEPLSPLRERKFSLIDRGNFNHVIERTAPRLVLQVQNRLTNTDSKISVELHFKSMEDFEPVNVLSQVPPLKELLDVRRRLDQLLSKLEGNDLLKSDLMAVLRFAGEPGTLLSKLEFGFPSAEQAGEVASLEQILEHARPVNKEDNEHNRTLIEHFVRQCIRSGPITSTDVEGTINAWLADIDGKLSRQLNEIMHAPEFQKLEGTWRGLHYLVHHTETSQTLQIKVLNVSKRELIKEQETAFEFDQSALFKKVYEDAFRVLGGHPYGLLVGDYEFSRRPEDIQLLTMTSRLAAFAHAPFIAAASPHLFNFDRFGELNCARDLTKIFSSSPYSAWNSFRESEESRYVGLTMPRVLGRLPYGAEFRQLDEFNFEEFIDGKGRDKYLWMNAAWAYAVRVTDAFAKYGWMARSCGDEGGKVEGLPVHTSYTDDGDTAMNCPTELAITDFFKSLLYNLGFLPLHHYKDGHFTGFLEARSCRKVKQVDDPAINEAARVSARLSSLLCASRFAHYIMLKCRDRIGCYIDREDYERWLNDWIQQYCIADPTVASDDEKARRPLQHARVEVRAVRDKPGYYKAVICLTPHFQFEQTGTALRIVAEVPKN